MPLSPQQQQEMQEMEELDALDKKFNSPNQNATGVTAQADKIKAASGAPGGLAQNVMGAVDKQLSPQGTQQIAANGLMSSVAPLAASGKGLSGFLGRMGTAVGQGAATGATAPIQGNESNVPLASPERMSHAGVGAAVGGAIGAAGEGLRGLMGLGKYAGRKMARFNQGEGEAYLDDPGKVGELAKSYNNRTPEMQDYASQAIEQGRQGLKAKGEESSAKLADLLSGKQVSVDPREIMSTQVPEASSIIERHLPTHMDIPNQVSIDANEANELKRILQKSSQFKPGTVLDPVQEARNKFTAATASNVRGAIEDVGGDAVQTLNSGMQEGTLLNKALKQGNKTNPIAFLTSESPDRMSQIARAESAGATGLQKAGSTLGAAKVMSGKDTDDAISRMVEKLIGRGVMRGANATTKGIGPATTAATIGATRIGTGQ